MDAIFEALTRIRAQRSGKLLAVGITISARQDPVDGQLRFARDCPLPADSNIAINLGQRLGVPCVVENDANALALFERYRGLGRGSDHFMCLYINEGVGIGIMANGRLYRGWQNQAGESGHWIVDPAGPSLPGIPTGSFEAYVSRPAIHRQLQAAGVECSESRAWLELSHHKYQDIVSTLIDRSALLCVNLFHIFAPQHIFLYGPLSELDINLGPAILDAGLRLTSPDRAERLKTVIQPRQDWAEAMAIGTAMAAIGPVLERSAP